MHNDPTRATGEAMPAVRPDPLFNLILDYARERDRFNAVEDATDEQTALDIIPLDRIRARLRDNPPAPTTANGAAAVLRFLAEHLEEGDIVNFHAPVLAAVLAYLENRWENWPSEALQQLARQRTHYALIQMRMAASLMAARKLSALRS